MFFLCEQIIDKLVVYSVQISTSILSKFICGRSHYALEKMKFSAHHFPVFAESILMLKQHCITKSMNYYSVIAVGSAHSLVSLWGVSDIFCIRTFTKLEKESTMDKC